LYAIACGYTEELSYHIEHLDLNSDIDHMPIVDFFLLPPNRQDVRNLGVPNLDGVLRHKYYG
jgi:hypothetical protein